MLNLAYAKMKQSAIFKGTGECSRIILHQKLVGENLKKVGHFILSSGVYLGSIQIVNIQLLPRVHFFYHFPPSGQTCSYSRHDRQDAGKIEEVQRVP